MRRFFSRREFVTSAGAAAAAMSLGRTASRAASPNEKLNIAAIGIGGMGAHNVGQCTGENIVALCDLDLGLSAKTIEAHPRAKVFTDYREMLDKQKDIDAVIIATPDHSHAVIAMACMRAGKHVYVQKPLAHSVHEARVLAETAREHQIVTQMGNQGHSGEGARLICEWVWSGAIGQVREVHAWTNRPVWPQGIEVGRPADTPAAPQGMDWDKWIGPAPFRPFHPEYHPQKWRAWWDFGTGSLGDLGCHVLDPIFWALRLGGPTSVEGNISTYWEGFWKKTDPKNECYPRSSIVRYKFPQRGEMAAVDLTWWDGGLMPPRPDELEGRQMGDADGGALLIGDKGKLVCGCYGRSPRLLPEARMREVGKPEASIPRVPMGEEGHERDWIRACKGGEPASSNFDYAGPLTEMVLIGNLATRFPDRRLLWDSAALKVTNDEDANAYVRRNYREGYSLES